MNILLRIVNLRKYLEYSEPTMNDAREILSSLLHLYDKPCKKENKDYIDLSDEELQKGLSQIREYIKDFDYNQILKQISNEKNLVKWYNEVQSSIDKLQIMRIFLNNNPNKLEDKVLFNYITESYHIENNEMMSLNEKNYNIIPNYIIKFCNCIMQEVEAEYTSVN